MHVKSDLEYGPRPKVHHSILVIFWNRGAACKSYVSSNRDWKYSRAQLNGLQPREQGTPLHPMSRVDRKHGGIIGLSFPDCAHVDHELSILLALAT
jgi:hypothetical protein